MRIQIRQVKDGELAQPIELSFEQLLQPKVLRAVLEADGVDKIILTPKKEDAEAE